MTSLLVALVASAAFVAVSSPTLAQVVASCGASSGYSYNLPGPITPAEQAGWTADTISKGGVQLMKDGESFDIIYTDALGGRSAKADGGTVVGYAAAAGFLVIVAYPSVIETYQFNFDSNQMLWTQNKAHPLSRKLAAFVSNCE